MKYEEQEKEFVEMIQKHSQIIYKVATFYVDQTQTLDDLYQETVLNLWKAFPNFRGESAASTWVYRIALNTCVSFFRRKKNKPVFTELQTEIEDIQEDKELIDELYRT